MLLQHSGGQAACELCAYQRIPYIVAILLAALAILICDPDAHPGWFTMTLANICMFGFFVSAGLAGFHYLISENWVIVSDTTRAALLNQDAWMSQTTEGGIFPIWHAGIALALGIAALMTLNRWEPSETKYRR
jgi:disulfide bond formation protein DsbB